MLPVLIVGSWLPHLWPTSTSSTLLGLGKPSYTAVANGSKFAFLLIGLPVGIEIYGLVGGVMVIAFSDLLRICSDPRSGKSGSASRSECRTCL